MHGLRWPGSGQLQTERPTAPPTPFRRLVDPSNLVSTKGPADEANRALVRNRYNICRRARKPRQSRDRKRYRRGPPARTPFAPRRRYRSSSLEVNEKFRRLPTTIRLLRLPLPPRRRRAGCESFSRREPDLGTIECWSDVNSPRRRQNANGPVHEEP